MFRSLDSDDLPAAQRLLCSGFPERSPAFWQHGLARLRAHGGNQAAGFPWGFGLFDAQALVGVALTPASVRRRADGGLSTLVNMSSWTIEPSHRWRALGMLRRMMADTRAAYIDLTPTPTVRRMLPYLGLEPVGTCNAVMLLPGHACGQSAGARLRPLALGEAPPWIGPLPELLDSHRALGCQPLLLLHDHGEDLLVYRRVRLRGLPAAQLVYVHSHQVLHRHLPALARYLLARGMVLLSCDSRVSGPNRWHTLYRPHGGWYARGADFSDRTDFLGSERCLLGV